jgi:hypothetical protein
MLRVRPRESIPLTRPAAHNQSGSTKDDQAVLANRSDLFGYCVYRVQAGLAISADGLSTVGVASAAESQ